jgi:hypothetical protein
MSQMPGGPTRGRVIRFRCRRCASALEALASQAGEQGRCPSCDAQFAIPQIDPYTGLATADADPGDDGQYPAPVHAYAAAGHAAPRVIRLPDDSLVIECPACTQQTAITANNCPKCGRPFTLEGMSNTVITAESRSHTLPLVLGLIALPLSMCAGIGAVPGIIAVGVGLRNLMLERKASSASGSIAGIIFGLLACVASVVYWVMQ